MVIDGINPNTGRLCTPAEHSQEAASSDFSKLLKTTISTGSTDLDELFESAASKYGVPANLLKAVAKAESGFNPSVVSSAGAQGIMQLMPATAAELGVTDPFDPEQCIMGGAKYLSRMLERFGGDAGLALAAYNAGPGSVTKYGGIPPYAETQAYVTKIMGYLGEDIKAGFVTGAKASSGLNADLSSLIMEGMLLDFLMSQPTGTLSDDEGDSN